MTFNLWRIAAAALVVGTAFAGGFAATNGASTAQAFKLKLTGPCMPGMKLVGSPNNSSYQCLRGLITVCKAGYNATGPTLSQKSTNLYQVVYSCQKPPK